MSIVGLIKVGQKRGRKLSKDRSETVSKIYEKMQRNGANNRGMEVDDEKGSITPRNT